MTIVKEIECSVSDNHSIFHRNFPSDIRFFGSLAQSHFFTGTLHSLPYFASKTPSGSEGIRNRSPLNNLPSKESKCFRSYSYVKISLGRVLPPFKKALNLIFSPTL